MARTNDFKDLLINRIGSFNKTPDILYEHWTALTVIISNDSLFGTIYYSFNGRDIDGRLEPDEVMKYNCEPIKRLWIYSTIGSNHPMRVWASS